METLESILPLLKPLEALIRDDSVTEITLIGPDNVFMEMNGEVSEVQGLALKGDYWLKAVKKIAIRLGSEISQRTPFLAWDLADGVCISAVIPPSNPAGVGLTISKGWLTRSNPSDLILVGMLDATTAKRLEEYVLARKNILVSGAPGARKEAVLSMLATFIRDGERVVLIEDSPKAKIANGTVLRLGTGKSALRSTRDLSEAARVHRPDRILVSNIRSSEAFELLRLMDAGMAGFLVSIQAPNALAALGRFTSSAIQAGANSSFHRLKSRIGKFVNAIVQIDRKPGRTRISEILEIDGYDPDTGLFDCRVVFCNQPDV